MKPFKSLRSSTEQAGEPLSESTLWTDPPQVLVLRRKAIRVFPGNQRVATYRNDNLDLEVAIPYNPETLGKHKISTVGVNDGVSESLEEAIKGWKHAHTDIARFRREAASASHPVKLIRLNKDGSESKMHDAAKTFKTEAEAHEHHNNITRLNPARHVAHNLYVDGQHKAKLHGLTEEVSLDEDTSDNLFGMYLKHSQAPTALHDRTFKPAKHIEAVVGKRYGEAALGHFKAAAHHYISGDTNAANAHFAKFKRHAAELGESTSDEPKTRFKAFKAKIQHPAVTHGPQKHAISKPMKALLTGEETEPMMEATIHTLHAITKRKQPMMVKFGNGSGAMVHHEVAARIMKLHSKVNKANKRKIENLVNSSPDGLKKVHEFVQLHLK